ncbi:MULTISPECIES: imidazole glycerol phosphate synthase subunit HisH [unclassified Lysobacter]|uniref:imidazole glycerol phosphate synthase subunit HisH n=1 Tax=unclassified Lysobacter TaxID=2635362 RepID=UPI0006FE94ED|nr:MULTISPECIES: imidazole glycerol phosphate synthase subunit HisH [unclassified Lysobacter]KQZ55556.1 imidazole glycerol phosphate synthase subunit HisH [Lysobacter sp. Root559]KRA70731.1 imidazole glycerol phosphate synthase subunit HisH [Lysobacter sp. Root667]KRC31490.1 imidazole glycerol phosphate synthase subunit HisH [Lysobacter sp. Root76]KRD65396.1 imidazole glycerol phosphate synthase subunit HisH [Lysobacter sp. Root96]
MTNVVLIDMGGGNIGSVRYALERLGAHAVLSADPATIGSAERVILPGVGAAAPAMARLRELGLVDTIRALRQPLLGICLGMQLLFESSEEGDVECLGLLPGRIGKLQPRPGVRVPHMGWNALERRRTSPLLDGIADGDRAYFVHSYAVPVGPDTLAASEHGAPFSAVVGRDNRYGAQFHPERSAAVGARLLRNFLDGVPA